MKKISFLIFAVALIFVSCKEDRDLESSLRYDGPNFNAPLLEADTYEAAARFPESITRDFVGQRLTQVSYYMAGVPQQTTLRIYSGGTSTEPGTVVYEAALTGEVSQNSFSAHVLDTPLEITGEDLWLSIRFRTNRTLQTIGCDEGPNTNGGDWLYREDDGRWLTFSQRTGESINWNIRGVVE